MALIPYAYFQDTDGNGFVLLPLGSQGDGAVRFTQLNDVPQSYTGEGGRTVALNSGETALEFIDPAFTKLEDAPASYSGQGGKLVGVNSGATALEFKPRTFTNLTDAPASYASSGNKYLLVNSGASAVVFGFPSGITDGSSAASGKIGELISSTIATGSATSLTTSTPKNITSISLTAGDWNVWGQVGVIGDTGTTLTFFIGGVSGTSATLGTAGTFQSQLSSITLGANNLRAATPILPVNITVTTTYYLVVNAVFGTSTLGGFGTLYARRVR